MEGLINSIKIMYRNPLQVKGSKSLINGQTNPIFIWICVSS